MNDVGDKLKAGPGNWKFSGEIVNRFDDHVSKSVPLYYEGHNLICDLAEFFVNDDSLVYEIGCSTGTLSLKMGESLSHKSGVRIIGYDIEKDMVDFAKKKSKQIVSKCNIEFICEDILTADLEAADMIVCYYTVQFIRPSMRQEVINKLYKSLNWGGALILYEKTRGADARFQDILSSLYMDYKLRKGYSPESIVSKSRSLKGVLEPFSTQGNIDMLKRAGFVDINIVQKYISFEGFLAIK